MIKKKRLLAVLMAAVMTVGQGGVLSYAGETVTEAAVSETAAEDTAVSAEETSSASEASADAESAGQTVTEAPEQSQTQDSSETVPETDAPETPAETNAQPVTETPTETNAQSVTETPTETNAQPATEIPTETNASSESETDHSGEIIVVPDDEIETIDPDESLTEEVEELALPELTYTSTLTDDSDPAVTFTLTFTDGTTVPKEYSQLDVEQYFEQDDEDVWKTWTGWIEDQMDTARRDIVDEWLYAVRVQAPDEKTLNTLEAIAPAASQPYMDLAGRSYTLTVTFHDTDSVSYPKLTVRDNQNFQAALYTIDYDSSKAQLESGDSKDLTDHHIIRRDSGERVLTGFTLNGKVPGSSQERIRFGVVTTQNHQNDGENVSAQRLADSLGTFGDYAVVTNTADQTGVSGVLSAAEDSQNAALISSNLGALAGLSEALSNAASADDVSVVNLYADADGTIDLTPLKTLSGSDESSVDVTGRIVVLNLVADSAEQSLSLPGLSVVSSDTDNELVRAGRVVYNIYTYKDQGTEDKHDYVYAPYTGVVSVPASAKGTVLASSATVSLGASLTGAVYANYVRTGDTALTNARIGNTGEQPQPDSENVTESATETLTEEESETGFTRPEDEKKDTGEEKLITIDENTVQKAAEESDGAVIKVTADVSPYTGIYADIGFTVTYEGTPVQTAPSQTSSLGVTDIQIPKTADDASYANTAFYAALDDSSVTTASAQLVISFDAAASKGYALAWNSTPQEEPSSETSETPETSETQANETEPSSENTDPATSQQITITVTRTTGEDAVNTYTVSYPSDAESAVFHVVSKNVDLKLSAQDSVNGSTITGGTYQISAEDGTVLMDADTLQETDSVTTDGDGVTTITLDTTQYEVLSSLTAGSTAVLTITETKAPAGYNEAIEPAAAVTVQRYADGHYEVVEVSGQTQTLQAVFVNEPGDFAIQAATISSSGNSQAYLSGAEYAIYSDSSYKNLVTSTQAFDSETGVSSLAFEPLESSLKSAFEQLYAGVTTSLTLYIEQTRAADGYERTSDSKDYRKQVTVTYDAQTGLAVSPDTVIFKNAPTVLTLNLKNVYNKGGKQTGIAFEKAAYKFTVNGSELKDADGKSVTLSTDSSDSSIRTAKLTLASYPAFEDLISGLDKSVTITVEQTTPETDYFLPKKASHTVKLSYDKEGNLKVQVDSAKENTRKQEQITFTERYLTGSISITLSDKYTPRNILTGYFDITISSDKGSLVITKDEPKTVERSGEVTFNSIDTPQIAQLVGSDDTLKVLVSERTTPKNYMVEGDAVRTLTLKLEDGSDDTVRTVTGKADFVNLKATTTEKIRIMKRLYLGTTTKDENYGLLYNPSKAMTYYVALFSDAARTKRVSGVYPITIQRNSIISTIEISNLQAGEYYVGETDISGNLVGTSRRPSEGGYFVSYTIPSGETEAGKITITGRTSTTHSVTVRNHYFRLTDGMEYFVLLAVRKVVTKDAQGTIDTSFNGVVNVTISYSTYSTSEKKMVTRNVRRALNVTNGQSPYSAVPIPIRTAPTSSEEEYSTTGTVDIRVRENSNYKIPAGYPKNTVFLADKKSYIVSMDQSSFTVNAHQSTIPRVTVTNQLYVKPDEPQTETETNNNGGNTQAQLTLTKKVTYKNNPIRVNSVYYIGIFDDANLSKLRYKKALQFSNASEVSATLKINLYKLASKEVTFYFAEVDKDGNVVSSGSSFGYNISQNTRSITLNPQNLNAELIITNDVLQGSNRERQLVNPSSGFAGDPAAVAEAQTLQSEANASASTTTGDTTPIWQYLIVLIVSGIIVMAAVLQRRSRKRR